MITTRRKLLGLLAAGAVIAPALLEIQRTIFLPPVGGWPHGRLAALIIPPEDAYMWGSEIEAGKVEYDAVNQLMTLLKSGPSSESPEWARQPFEPVEVPRPHYLNPAGVQWFGYRGDIQAREMAGWKDHILAERLRREESSPEWIEEYARRDLEEAKRLAQQQSADLVTDPASRARATARAAEIRARIGKV